MAARNSIHPTAIVGPGAELGDGNTVGPFAVIIGPCRIGNRNWIGPHVAIGTPAQLRGGDHPAGWQDGTGTGRVEIGDDNVIREFVTVHQPTEGRTAVGSSCYLMAYSHVPHDATIGDGVTIANAVQIGGHTTVGSGANLGLGAVVHQRLVIGGGAMIGMGAVVTRDVDPFAIAYGSPAKVSGVNRVGLQRGGFDEATIAMVEEYLRGDPTGAPPSGLPDELLAVFAAHAAATHRLP